jgi:amino acid adenylation domain-containing protein
VIHSQFEEQVFRSPNRIAVVFEENRLTYRELDKRASQLARHLRLQGVIPGALVGLFLERSAELIVAMLAILKAGGAYVPLDPTHPPDRISLILNSSRPLVIVTTEQLQAKLPEHSSGVVLIDSFDRMNGEQEEVNLGQQNDPDNLAYVIYTSGSTGIPKGVEIEHRSVLNMLSSMRQRPGFSADDTMLAITTVTFDIAALEIFLPLICGGCVVVAPSRMTVDGGALAELIGRCEATVLQGTPSTFRMLLDAGWTGSPRLKLLCGGEAWGEDLANKLLSCCNSLWNMYGPTETTVWSAVAKVYPDRKIILGQPIANTKLYVLNAGRQLVPIGVSGELHIGGSGLARGYHGQPELTKERFVKDPFSQDPTSRLYRTGDSVRRLQDGSLEFLGRLDNQVKIRGFRIELGEIESALRTAFRVRQAAVTVREDEPGDRRLIAYLICGESELPSDSELRHQLRKKLPDYMIPSAFVELEHFPLTPNGKLDRNALPVPTNTQAVITSGASTDTERVLLRIWCETLHLEGINLNDNFFDLGGHSLLAVRIIGAINKAFGSRLGVVDLFLTPTIEGLGKTLTRSKTEKKEIQTDFKSRIVCLKEGSLDCPVYLIDASPDHFALAQKIVGHAVFGVEVRWPRDWHRSAALNRVRDFPDLVEFSTPFAAALLAHRQRGPCIVGGYSFGGLIAYEVAHQARRAGVQVAAVFLFDAWRRLPKVSEIISFLIRQFVKLPTGSRSVHSSFRLSAKTSIVLLRWCLASIINQLPFRIRRRGQPHDLTAILDEDGLPISWSYIRRLYLRASMTYKPAILDAAGLLFSADDKIGAAFRGIMEDHGWRGCFSKGLDMRKVPGDHMSIFSDEHHRSALVFQLNDALKPYTRYAEPGEDRALAKAPVPDSV